MWHVRTPLARWTLLGCLAGCSGQPPQPAPVPTPPAPAPSVSQTPAPGPAPTAKEPEPLPVISLGGSTAKPANGTATPTAGDAGNAARQAAIAALQPYQSLLGKWRGITRKEVSDFKGIEAPEWVWDLRTDRAKPSLVMESPTGVYYRKLRMTGTGNPDQFTLVATDAEGRERVLQGSVVEPLEQFQEGGTTVQHKFKLQFEEQGDARDRWQLTLAQQNNDRYLVELSRVRPAGIQRIDTIGHQRDGTSVAKSDTDYGEKKCIISGGLGTIAVSYKGKTYWVCCTGCQAAFNDDPKAGSETRQKRRLSNH